MYCSRVDPNAMTSVLIRDTQRRHHVKAETETGVIRPKAKEPQELEEHGTDPLKASEGTSSAHTPRSRWTGHVKLIVRYGFIF